MGLDPDAAQFVDRMLGRLGLHLAGVNDVGHQGQVDEHRPLGTQVRVELADRLEESERLDVTDRAADLGDHEVDLLGLGHDQDAVLDLVGDVRDHLDGAAEVVAAALAPDHRVVDRAGGHIRGPRSVLVGEALVMAEVKVGLGPVFGDEDLAVLEGAHRARVDVQVRIELLDLDPETAGNEEPADRGGSDAFTESRKHSAGDEDESGFSLVLVAHLTLPRESINRSGGSRSMVFEIDRNSP